MGIRTASPSGLTALLAVLGLAAASVLLWPVAASAHTYLESSDPEADTAVTEPVETVTLVFNQDVDQTIAEVEVAGPAEGQSGGGDPRIEGERVELSVDPLPEHGEYTVRYRVIAADGHPVQGTFSFTYEGPLPPGPTEEPEDTAQAGDDRAAAPAPRQDAPAPPPAPQAGQQPAPAAAAEQPQPSAAALVADRWPLLLVAAVVLAAAVTASVYAARAVARWQPDPGS